MLQYSWQMLFNKIGTLRLHTDPAITLDEFRPRGQIRSRMLVIDGHLHLAGEFDDPARLIAQLDANGIARGLVFANPFRSLDGPHAPKVYLKVINNSPIGTWVLQYLSHSKKFDDTVLLQPDNRSVYQAVSQYPNRLRGLVFINPGLPGALAELRTGIEGHGLSGIKMHLYLHPINLADSRVIRIMQYAHERALPILIDLGIHARNAVPIFQLAQGFPKINFIIPHLGGTLFEMVLKKAGPLKNIYIDTSGYVVTMARALRMLQTVGAARMIFGSDGPAKFGGDFSDSFDTITNLPISKYEKSLILGGNIERILTPKSGDARSRLEIGEPIAGSVVPKRLVIAPPLV